MKTRNILAIAVIIIIAVAAVFGAWWVYFRPTGVVTIAILAESTPEALTFTDSSVLSMYKNSHPGIDFVVDVVPREVFSTLALREIIEKTGRYDIMTGSEDEIYKGRQNGGFYALEDLDAIDPTFIAQVRPDIIQTCKDPATGKMDTLPLTHWNSQCLFYRKDLFENATEKAAFLARYGYELSPPQTWQQLLDTAEFFTRPPDLYGFWTTGAVGWALVYGEFWTWMQSMNGDIVTGTNVTIDTPAWRAALEFQKNLTAFAPPDWQGSDWFEGLKVFEQGKIALHEQFYFPWADFFDSNKVAAQVLNNVGVIAPPTSPINVSRGALTFTPAEQLLKSSPHPHEAAAFLKWMQGYDVQKTMALTGNLMLPIRADVDADPQVDAKIHSSGIINMTGLSEYVLTPLGAPAFYPKVSEVEPILAEGYSKYMSGEWTLDQTISFLQTQVTTIINS
jgi:ABC-type glycerol-3-phosphate transport system substrate-binding protein